MTNVVVLVGNLTKDVELKTLDNGTKVGNFNIAVNRKYKDTEGKQVTDFFNCVAFNKVIENLSKYAGKGSRVAVTGALQNREYDDNGNKKYFTEIVANEVEFLTTKKAEEEVEKKVPADLKEVTDKDLPF